MTVTNKRYQAANARARNYQDAIWYDSKYDFSALKKDTRAILVETAQQRRRDLRLCVGRAVIDGEVPA